MNKWKLSIVLSFIMCVMIPVILFSYAGNKQMAPATSYPTEYSLAAETEQESTKYPEETKPPAREFMLKVLNSQGECEVKELEDYLVGVVLGEMPVYFTNDALMAQAVVARTFTLRRVENMDKHDAAAVCMNPGCCQAYLSPAEFVNSKGGSTEDLEKVRSCVKATAGQVLTYHDEYIEATYFSASGGRTEDAVAVWGADVPYLIAQDCPGEENVHERVQTMTPKQLALILNLPTDNVSVDYVVYTKGDGVDEISISGKKFSGSQMRKLLNLDSTMFRLEKNDHEILITSKGYGHRVGMSQYGADAMAKNGADYKEILSYFYPGTKLENLWED